MPSLAPQVTDHIMIGIVRWCLETVDLDRLKYNDEHSGDSQDSEGHTRGAVEAAAFEAPGFNAISRVSAFISKYRKPAAGGGKSGTTRASQLENRPYLHTANDQTFNDL